MIKNIKYIVVFVTAVLGLILGSYQSPLSGQQNYPGLREQYTAISGELVVLVGKYKDKPLMSAMLKNKINEGIVKNIQPDQLMKAVREYDIRLKIVSDLLAELKRSSSVQEEEEGVLLSCLMDLLREGIGPDDLSSLARHSVRTGGGRKFCFITELGLDIFRQDLKRDDVLALLTGLSRNSMKERDDIFYLKKLLLLAKQLELSPGRAVEIIRQGLSRNRSWKTIESMLKDEARFYRSRIKNKR
ncbi:MAG: hypothetical protein PHF84_11525 [bacterium]|nr:hypothetical protein [bacterium]